ncbi:hypothetical protein MSG28_013395 [Choristoneura fumiferana]|uniref:Uncharacterized protein n=1 Tax=Choristoneura fumiferana TaxID=7141 RepID=A0ACC0KU58_CHOFU|nr:hypothetical protein MSG28_013395 [Choristoneura fumiferana]
MYLKLILVCALLLVDSNLASLLTACKCPMTYIPLCASNGKSYMNKCEMLCDGPELTLKTEVRKTEGLKILGLRTEGLRTRISEGLKVRVDQGVKEMDANL